MHHLSPIWPKHALLHRICMIHITGWQPASCCQQCSLKRVCAKTLGPILPHTVQQCFCWCSASVDIGTFERLCEALTRNIAKALRQALANARCTPASIAVVERVGGASRTPSVVRAIQSVFELPQGPKWCWPSPCQLNIAHPGKQPEAELARCTSPASTPRWVDVAHAHANSTAATASVPVHVPVCDCPGDAV